MRGAGLVLLLALPSSAAQDRAVEVRRLEELERIYESYLLVSRKREAVLKEISAARMAYADAPDAEGRLAGWETRLAALAALSAEEDRLFTSHRLGIRDLDVSAISGVLDRIGHGEAPADRRSPAFREAERHGKLLRAHRARFNAIYLREGDAFKLAAKIRSVQREHAARNRKLAWTLSGTAVAAVLAALHWRRGTGDPKRVILRAGPPVPRLISGNIEVLGLIGRGSMGEVFEAVDKTLGRRTALKRLRGELLASPSDLERLLAEARLVASLKHPNLVAIYSVERDAGQVYLAFEFVDGTTLARLIADQRIEIKLFHRSLLSHLRKQSGGLNAIVILLRDRIVLVLMTAGTAER